MYVCDDSDLSLTKSSHTFRGAWLRSKEIVVYDQMYVDQKCTEQNC